MDEIKDLVLSEYEKGNVVIADIEGLKTANLKEFIKQNIQGLLYDLNRNESVVLTFIKDPKWVNDFAVCKVITELKSQNEKLRNVINTLLDSICFVKTEHNSDYIITQQDIDLLKSV